MQKNLEDMDSDDWASSSDESESSSSEDEDTGELKGRARWLKRTVNHDEASQEGTRDREEEGEESY